MMRLLSLIMMSNFALFLFVLLVDVQANTTEPSLEKSPSGKVPVPAALTSKVPSAQGAVALTTNPKFASIVENTIAAHNHRGDAASAHQKALARWKMLRIAFHTVNTIDDLCDERTLEEVKAHEAAQQAKWASAWRKIQKGWQNVKAQFADWALDVQVFREWLMRADHVEMLIQVLISMGSMKTPICFTLQMLEGINGTEPILKEIQKLANQQNDTKTTTTAENGGVRAYMFGEKGLTALLLTESVDNLSCASSLDEPQQTAALLTQTIAALQENSPEEALNVVMESVITHLQNPNFDIQLGSIGRAVVEGWKEATSKMSWVKVGQGLEKFAVWLIAPTHVEFVIKTLMYITGLMAPFTISINILAAFGLDQVLIIQYFEGLGVNMINHGANGNVAMWAFGPNGVIPLFLRNGSQTDEEMPAEYVDHTGKSYTKTELDKIYQKLEEEGTCLKQIMEAIITHQGHPFHQLMDHMVVVFKELGNKLQRGVQRMAQQMDEEWHKIKAIQWSDVEKGFVTAWMYLITPVHVNNAIKIVLTLTEAAEPVYLTLEVLEALHITDFMESGLIKAEQAMQDWDFIKNNRQLMGAVDFQIGQDGLVPMFLHDGDIGEYSRAARISDEANIMNAVIDIASDNPGALGFFEGLWKVVVAKFTDKSSLLAILQKWNSLNIQLRTSTKTMYEELSEMKKEKIAQQQKAAAKLQGKSANNTTTTINNGNTDANIVESIINANDAQKQQQKQLLATAHNLEQIWPQRWYYGMV